MANDDYWKLLDNEGRFNTIQATIRGVAATWLLATMAAVGMALRKGSGAPEWIWPRSDIVLLALAASSVGLVILWVLDLQVYQRLLGATFVHRLYMEYRDPTIPPLAATMMSSSSNKGMSRIFGYFYALPVVAYLAAALVIVALGTANGANVGVGWMGRLAALALVIACALLLLFGGRSSSIQLSMEFPDEGYQALFKDGQSRLESVVRAYARNGTRRWVGKPFAHKLLPARADKVAPDGSDVRILPGLFGGGMAHFELGPGEISTAVRHKTVEEIWFVVRGEGMMWRRQNDSEEVVPMVPGMCLTIPLGTSFQFKSMTIEPLAAIGVTMPPWPGDDEADVVKGKWQPTVPPDLIPENQGM